MSDPIIAYGAALRAVKTSHQVSYNTATVWAEDADCLLAGTLIALADGTYKPVEKIQKGDLVLAFLENLERTGASEVIAVHAPYTTEAYYVINGTLKLTANHPLLSGDRWVSAAELKTGDVLTNGDGVSTPVKSIRCVNEQAVVYNFQVAGGTYLADDVVVHNKEDCLEFMAYPCYECGP